MRLVRPLLTLLLSGIFFWTHSQTVLSNSQLPGDYRLGLSTLRSMKAKARNFTTVDLLVKGETEGIKKAVEQAGGTYKMGVRGIHSVSIPKESVTKFLDNVAVGGVESGHSPLRPMSDVAIYNNNIAPVHDGQAPLDTSYKGDGVILGVIDAGIYIFHPDFQFPNGKSRIRYIWDQNAGNTNSPLPYNYGREWKGTDIDNNVCTHVEPSGQFGHGTNVAGAAAGNGKATGKYVGMAPNTELIVVAFNYSKPYLSTFVDAVDYIFKKADAMGRPCVINASMGTYFGSRDGNDFAAEIIDGLLEERAGRVLVCASGNAGHLNYHLHNDVGSDTSFTWFKYNSNPGAGDVFFQLWADTAGFNNVYFSIGADDPTNNYYYLGNIPFLNIKNAYGNLQEGVPSSIISYVLNDNNNFVGTINSQATLTEGRYFIEFQVQPNNTAHYWRLMTFGNGAFDIWSSKSLMNLADMVENTPSSTVMPAIIHYRYPDNKQSIVSSFATSDKVITVGNYSNRAYYVDFNSDTFWTNETPQELYYTSSTGPTRDGRVKPDITATGSTTISTGNLTYIAQLKSSGQAYKVAEGGWHNRNGGTSLAAPIVSAAAALYLEKNPAADWREVKDAITLSAKQDNYTTSNIPNNSWGYGKLDAFAMMQMELLYGCMDTGALNYDPNANMDSGDCIEAIEGCMDPMATNYNPDANVSGNCEYVQDTTDTIGIFSLNEALLNFDIFPNPTSGTSIIQYKLRSNTDGNTYLRINDLAGKELDRLQLNDTAGEIHYHWKGEKGVYLIQLEQDGKLVGSRKLVVY